MLRILGLENFHIVFLTPLLRYIDVRESSSLCSPVKLPHSQGSEHVCHFASAASAPPPAPPQTTPGLWALQQLRRLGVDSGMHALVQLLSLSKIILRNISVECISFTF